MQLKPCTATCEALVRSSEDADLMMSSILLKRAIDTPSSSIVCREAFDWLWYVSECIVEYKIAPLLRGQKEALHKGFALLSLQVTITFRQRLFSRPSFKRCKKETGSSVRAILFVYHNCEVSCDKNHDTRPK